MRYLRQEDQDCQGVDEAEHHRARHESHQLADTEVAEANLEDARKDRRREEVLDAVLLHEGNEDQCHRSRGG